MILLNRKIDYALLILCYLHRRSQGGSAREIAGHFGISRPFVANILKDLCHKGFVHSQRGVKGGYTLREATAGKSLADLMDALDDTVRLAECNTPAGAECCSHAMTCPVRAPIAEVHERIRAVLESARLIDIFEAPPAESIPVELTISRCEPAPTVS